VACNFSIPASSQFSYWFAQGLTIGEGFNLQNNYQRLLIGPLGALSSDISYDNISFTYALRWFDTGSLYGAYIGETFRATDDISGALTNFSISNVPYDILGTGIKCDQVNPPVASFTYSPENPLLGQEITFDASGSDEL
jgi:hypothetical protein